MSDNERLKVLMLQISQGNETAFSTVFELFFDKVHTFALKLVKNEELAEEITQDVFLKIWINRAELSRIDYFPSYLYTITRNHCFNILKRIARENTIKAIISQRSSNIDIQTEQGLLVKEYEQLLQEAIAKLSPQQRKVYTLCQLEGKKYEEAAAILGISRLTIKTHMQQALRLVRSYMESHLGICLPLIWFFL